jgi:hypothetical protein
LAALALAGCGSSASSLVVSVEDPGQHPIRGATVTVVGEHVSSRTGSGGEAHLSHLTPGVYSVVKVSALGYTTVRETDISVPFGGTLLVTLRRAAPVKPRTGA